MTPNRDDYEVQLFSLHEDHREYGVNPADFSVVYFVANFALVYFVVVVVAHFVVVVVALYAASLHLQLLQPY